MQVEKLAVDVSNEDHRIRHLHQIIFFAFGKSEKWQLLRILRA